MNKRQKKKQIKTKNKELINKYPFLLPRNVWTGLPVKKYNYMHTELDCIPNGWKKTFGEIMCEDIKNILIKENMLNEYRISQIKEKYGSLRIYDFGHPEEIDDIYYKYEYISERTCICCGKFDVNLFDDGWISPYCDNCFLTGYRKKEKMMKKYSKKEIQTLSNKNILEKYKIEKEPLKNELIIEEIKGKIKTKRSISLLDIINKIKK